MARSLISTTTEGHHHCCLLDLTFGSYLLASKMADIPHKNKFETIIQPIFEYCFGTSDELIVWEELNNHNIESNTDDDIISDQIIYNIDWIKDRTFLYDQIFDLVYERFCILATKTRMWNNRILVLDIFQYFPDIDVLSNVKHDFRQDREIVLAAVKEFGMNLKYASTELKNDFEIVSIAVNEYGFALEFASNELKNNKEIVKLAIRNHASCIEYASPELRMDFDLIKQAVEQDGFTLQFASEELKNNKEMVLLALESFPRAYNYASDQLKEDRDVLVKSLSKSLNHISEVSERFNNDREFLEMLLKVDGAYALLYASNELKNDREFVKQAIQKDAYSICYASDELKNDREMVKLAVTKDGNSLEYQLSEFQDDNEIAELALKSSVSAIEYISDRLKSDCEFIYKAVGKRVYYDLPEDDLIYDEEILLESIKINPSNLQRIPNELKPNREFILKAVSSCGRGLEFVSDNFKQDREIVMAAISENGNAIRFASKQLENDVELILKASESCHQTYLKSFISDRLRNDRGMVLQLAKKGFLGMFPRKFFLDREILLTDLALSRISYKTLATDRLVAIRLVKKDGMLLGEMCSKHRNDREIVSCAVNQNKESLRYASIELINKKSRKA